MCIYIYVCVCVCVCIYIYIYVCVCVCVYMKSSDAKASKCHLKLSFFAICKLQIAIFSGSYIYVQLFDLNGNEKNLFDTIKVKLLNLHMRA